MGNQKKKYANITNEFPGLKQIHQWITNTATWRMGKAITPWALYNSVSYQIGKLFLVYTNIVSYTSG